MSKVSVSCDFIVASCASIVDSALLSGYFNLIIKTLNTCYCCQRHQNDKPIKLEKYFEDIDLTIVDDHGKPIFSAKDLVANLSKVGDVVSGLHRLEELVKKEDQKSSKVRGGVEINKYSQ